MLPILMITFLVLQSQASPQGFSRGSSLGGLPSGFSGLGFSRGSSLGGFSSDFSRGGLPSGFSGLGVSRDSFGGGLPSGFSGLGAFRGSSGTGFSRGSSGGGCPSGWKNDGSSCYKVFNDRATWNSARDACVNSGGALVTFDGHDEQEFIRGLKTSDTWIGLYDKKWIDGTVMGFSIRSNPHFKCGYMTGGGLLRSKSCETQQPYMCKQQSA